jgi:hypothetical protein
VVYRRTVDFAGEGFGIPYAVDADAALWRTGDDDVVCVWDLAAVELAGEVVLVPEVFRGVGAGAGDVVGGVLAVGGVDGAAVQDAFEVLGVPDQPSPAFACRRIHHTRLKRHQRTVQDTRLRRSTPGKAFPTLTNPINLISAIGIVNATTIQHTLKVLGIKLIQRDTFTGIRPIGNTRTIRDLHTVDHTGNGEGVPHVILDAGADVVDVAGVVGVGDLGAVDGAGEVGGVPEVGRVAGAAALWSGVGAGGVIDKGTVKIAGVGIRVPGEGN